MCINIHVLYTLHITHVHVLYIIHVHVHSLTL